MRGSIDRGPGSKLASHSNNAGAARSNKKYSKLQMEQKGGNQQSAGATRRGASHQHQPGGRGMRTKSSVGGPSLDGKGGAQQHPLVRGKQTNAKVSMSSSNLDESIGGVVGSKI